jgi:hypothetical protein
MSKKREPAASAPDNGTATATAQTPQKQKRQREKVPYRLEQSATADEPEKRILRCWQQVEGSPNFDDTAAAIKWAQENAINVSADLRVVAIKAEFKIETETVTKAVIKTK